MTLAEGSKEGRKEEGCLVRKVGISIFLMLKLDMPTSKVNCTTLKDARN